jgi:hypothetical protein
MHSITKSLFIKDQDRYKLNKRCFSDSLKLLMFLLFTICFTILLLNELGLNFLRKLIADEVFTSLE